VTDADVKRLLDYVPFDPLPVCVKTNDYAYDGWLVGWGERRNGRFITLVEDHFGRVFLHRAMELRKR